MIVIPGLVGLLLVLTADAKLGPSSESTLCTETKECLLYDEVCDKKNENYEVRHYSALKWVSTEEEGYFMEAPTYKAFMRLFGYITGENEQGAKIDMTSPVIIKEKTKASSSFPWFSTKVYTMSFLLPAQHQNNPPRPNDEKVYFTDMPDMKVYVRSYGGWMGSWMTWPQVSSLAKDLKAAGAQFNQDFSYSVGYDSPMKMLGRHNEVWYVVEGEHVC